MNIMDNEIIHILFLAVGSFAWNQIGVWTIGNRQYSISYMTRATFERKGILKLIYFKPKHFGCYSIWEIIGFYFSYIVLFVSLLFACVGLANEGIAKIGVFISFVLFGISFIFGIIKIIYIEVSRLIEENKEKHNRKNIHNAANFEGFEHSKIIDSMFAYALTKRGQLESLYQREICKIKKEDLESIAKVNKAFKKYFSDIDYIEIENNKIIYTSGARASFEVEYIFYSGKRKEMPILNTKVYRPHVVINGSKEFLGICFVNGTVNQFDQLGTGTIEGLYSPYMYDCLTEGIEFTIREGNKIVGRGKILVRNHEK